MEHGDLATSVRPRQIVVLEGVLATVAPIEKERRFRQPEIVGWNIQWHDLALKRCATNKRRFPDVALEVVTFTNQQVCDFVAEFLLDIDLAADSVEYRPFQRFIERLRYQTDIVSIIDSDPSRLDHYGQLGHATTVGQDFG